MGDERLRQDGGADGAEAHRGRGSDGGGAPGAAPADGAFLRARARRRPLALLAGVLLAGGVSCEPPPLFDVELLQNPDFEAGTLEGWTVDQGSCEAVGPGFPWSTPHGGSWLFYGGDGPAASHCRASQTVDFLANTGVHWWIDHGTVALDAEAWLRSFLNEGSFDDQIQLRVRYLGADDAEIASVVTLIGGDDAWKRREATGLVPPGTRKVRLELDARRRRGNDNDGMADDASLWLVDEVTAVSPVLTKKPMLQDVRQDAMTLLWETDGNLAVPSVEWGPAGGGLPHTVRKVETTQVDATHFVHKATIPGLAAGTEYDYRVRNGATVSATWRFRTAPLATSPYTIAWIADNQNGPSTFRQHVNQLAQRDPDLVIAPGDVVQNGNVLSEWQDYWFGPLEESSFAQTTPVVFARGNHDGEHALAYAYSALPGNGSWYAFSYGNAYVVVLDTESSTGNESPTESQLQFLHQKLGSPEAQSAAFRIVTFHKPPYTNLWDLTGLFCAYNGESFVRNDWVPLFELYGVDLVVAGHAHAYQRATRNGVIYLTVGGGGGALDTIRGCFGSPYWNFFQVEQSRFHHNVMSVSGSLLEWRSYDLNGSLVDQFQIAN